jgi:hypothetical protein
LKRRPRVDNARWSAPARASARNYIRGATPAGSHPLIARPPRPPDNARAREVFAAPIPRRMVPGPQPSETASTRAGTGLDTLTRRRRVPQGVLFCVVVRPGPAVAANYPCTTRSCPETLGHKGGLSP